MVWRLRTEELTNPRGLRCTIQVDSNSASVFAVMSSLKVNSEFRSFFNSVLAAVPYEAFRWETPGVTESSSSESFEFVILDSPNLDRTPDSSAFESHFIQPDQTVTTFPNLRADALLIVPYPVAKTAAYGHLAGFVRNAPASQQDALWQSVGDAMTKRLNAQPVWLNTAGAGVPWLHVRLDDSPKYYHFAPYRSPPK